MSAPSFNVGDHVLASGLKGFASDRLRVRIARIDERSGTIFVHTADLQDAGTYLALDALQIAPEPTPAPDHDLAASPTFTYDRPLLEDERALMTHVTMFGSDGYPVARVGSRHWSWSYRSLSAPGVYKTKREATTAFESYLEVLRSCLAAAAYKRAVAIERGHCDLEADGCRPGVTCGCDCLDCHRAFLAEAAAGRRIMGVKS